MLSLKRILPLLSSTAIFILLMAGLLHAEERFITDTIIVSLREGPGAQYKVIKTLKTGQSFDVLENLNGFVRVKTKEGDEGWLQDRFTDVRPPETAMSRDLEGKPATLAAQKDLLPSSSGLSPVQQTASVNESQPQKVFSEQNAPKEPTDLKKLQSELASMTKQFKQLEADSKDFLEIKAENDRLKEEFSNLQKKAAQLEQANTTLEKQQNIYWFIAGGGVFLLGWMIGRITIRRQRHSSSLTL